jgi:hypothetical protein
LEAKPVLSAGILDNRRDNFRAHNQAPPWMTGVLVALDTWRRLVSPRKEVAKRKPSRGAAEA